MNVTYLAKIDGTEKYYCFLDLPKNKLKYDSEIEQYIYNDVNIDSINQTVKIGDILYKIDFFMEANEEKKLELKNKCVNSDWKPDTNLDIVNVEEPVFVEVGKTAIISGLIMCIGMFIINDKKQVIAAHIVSVENDKEREKLRKNVKKIIDIMKEHNFVKKCSMYLCMQTRHILVEKQSQNETCDILIEELKDYYNNYEKMDLASSKIRYSGKFIL